jgi:hypothetical protein
MLRLTAVKMDVIAAKMNDIVVKMDAIAAKMNNIVTK